MPNTTSVPKQAAKHKDRIYLKLLILPQEILSVDFPVVKF